MAVAVIRRGAARRCSRPDLVTGRSYKVRFTWPVSGISAGTEVATHREHGRDLTTRAGAALFSSSARAVRAPGSGAGPLRDSPGRIITAASASGCDPAKGRRVLVRRMAPGTPHGQ